MVWTAENHEEQRRAQGMTLAQSPGETKAVNVKRLPLTLNPDPCRVLVRPFRFNNPQRAVNICARVMSLSESDVRRLLEQVLAEFGDRHMQMRDLLKLRYQQIEQHMLTNDRISEERKLLVGSYFTHEYALEAAA